MIERNGSTNMSSILSAVPEVAVYQFNVLSEAIADNHNAIGPHHKLPGVEPKKSKNTDAY